MSANDKNDYGNRAVGGAGASGDNPRQAVQSAVEDAKGAIDEASSALGETAEGAREAIGNLTDEAQKIAADAGEKAKTFVEENKGRAAEQISGIQSAIAKAADELEAKGQGQFAKYTRDLANGLESLSGSINEKGVDDLMASVGQFARNQPAAFLGAAALLGFAASRFAMSTAKAASSDAGAKSQNQSANQGQGQNQWQGSSTGGSSYGSRPNGVGSGGSTYAGGN